MAVENPELPTDPPKDADPTTVYAMDLGNVALEAVLKAKPGSAIAKAAERVIEELGSNAGGEIHAAFGNIP